jgi:hypothetical protein
VDHDPVRPALGFRVDYRGRSLVVSGDTVKSDAVAEHAQQVDLLVHEALSPELVMIMNDAAEATGNAGMAKIALDILDYHASPVQAAETARDAEVGHLLFYHIVPALPPIPGAEAAWLQDLQGFRAAREERLRSPDSWFGLVGLHWLAEGEQGVGSGEQAGIRLAVVPLELGTIRPEPESLSARLSLAEGVQVRLDGEVRAEEREAVETAVLGHFDLSAEEAGALLKLAEDERRDATDYFQFTSLINRHYTPERKIELIDALSETGLNHIQTVSFVNSKRVPGWADAEEVVAGFTPKPGVRYTGLWLNDKGLERAIATDKLHIRGSISLTASEEFLLRNQRRTLAENVEAQRGMIQLFKKQLKQ